MRWVQIYNMRLNFGPTVARLRLTDGSLWACPEASSSPIEMWTKWNLKLPPSSGLFTGRTSCWLVKIKETSHDAVFVMRMRKTENGVGLRGLWLVQADDGTCVNTLTTWWGWCQLSIISCHHVTGSERSCDKHQVELLRRRQSLELVNRKQRTIIQHLLMIFFKAQYFCVFSSSFFFLSLDLIEEWDKPKSEMSNDPSEA